MARLVVSFTMLMPMLAVVVAVLSPMSEMWSLMSLQIPAATCSAFLLSIFWISRA